MSLTRKGSPMEVSITYKVDNVRVDPFTMIFPAGTFLNSSLILSLYEFITDETYLPLFMRRNQDKIVRIFA